MFFKLPLLWFFYHFGWPKILPFNYTFSLTSQCNSRCFTCNIWRKSSTSRGSLTASEWKKIFVSLGKSPYWVTISGGESFLRKDLTTIIKSLCSLCQPKMINFPTNGLLTGKIVTDVQEMVAQFPKTRFVVNLSLDGIGKDHDKIRGVEGNFKKAIATFEGLRKLRLANLSLGIHTVISRKNVANFDSLCDFVLDTLRPDSYVTEIAEEREELHNLGSKISPDRVLYEKAIAYLEKRQRAWSPTGFGKLTSAFRQSYYKLAIKTLKEKRQIIPCFAGFASAQIAPNGDVWACCVKAESMGNLRSGFNFKKIWFSKKALMAREAIKKGSCFCPLANASLSNMVLSPKTMLSVFKNYFLG